MHHKIVLEQISHFVKDKRILSIIHQYLDRMEIREGAYYAVKQVIPKGCSLSPWVGAMMLKSLDELCPDGVTYIRYMDDWVILTKTRSMLSRLVKKMHVIMHQLQFKLALDKTYIGKISKGFDFLGYHFNAAGMVDVAEKTMQKFIERLLVLYKQRDATSRIEQYVRRWQSWCLIPLINLDKIVNAIKQGSYHGEIYLEERRARA
jgi:RNA-directed DNA polymerase